LAYATKPVLFVYLKSDYHSTKVMRDSIDFKDYAELQTKDGH